MRSTRVSVTRFWKQGNVGHKNVPQLLRLDLSPFRDKARQVIRLDLA